MRSPFASILALTFVLTSSPVWAAEERAKSEPTAFDRALSMHQGHTTKESIVDLGGRKYRRIEHKSDVYYLQLISEEMSATNLTVVCGEKGLQRFNSEAPKLIAGSIKLTRRTSLFIEGLRTICTGDPGRERILLDPLLLVGFTLDDGTDQKALLRNKRVFISPFGAFGFAADW